MDCSIELSSIKRELSDLNYGIKHLTEQLETMNRLIAAFNNNYIAINGQKPVDEFVEEDAED